jgi:hypothetical protein
MSGIGLGVREVLPDQRFEVPNLTGWKVLGVRVFQLADDEFCEPPSPFRQHGHGLGHRESFVSLSLDRDSKHGTTTVGLVLRALKETFDRTTMDREFAHDGEGRYAARQLRASRHPREAGLTVPGARRVRKFSRPDLQGNRAGAREA